MVTVTHETGNTGASWGKNAPFPIQATDDNRQTSMNNIDNPWVKWTLQTCKTIIKEHKLKNNITTLKWCALWLQVYT